MRDRIYVDYNATTPLHPEAQKALLDGLAQFGNPSSLHQEGQAAKASLEQSRSVVSSWIGAKPDQCVFLGSGSEANNMVIKHSKIFFIIMVLKFILYSYLSFLLYKNDQMYNKFLKKLYKKSFFFNFK